MKWQHNLKFPITSWDSQIRKKSFHRLSKKSNPKTPRKTESHQEISNLRINFSNHDDSEILDAFVFFFPGYCWFFKAMVGGLVRYFLAKSVGGLDLIEEGWKAFGWVWALQNNSAKNQLGERNKCRPSRWKTAFGVERWSNHWELFFRYICQIVYSSIWLFRTKNKDYGYGCE